MAKSIYDAQTIEELHDAIERFSIELNKLPPMARIHGAFDLAQAQIRFNGMVNEKFKTLASAFEIELATMRERHERTRQG